MKRTNFLIISMIILVLLNVFTLGFIIYTKRNSGRELPAGSDRHRNEPSAFIIEKLQLNEQQQREFEHLKSRHRAATESIRKEDKILHDAFFDLLKTDNPDKQKADSLATLVAGQQKKLVESAFDHFTALRNICTDTQKKLFDENINQITRIVAERRPQQVPHPPPPGGPHP